MKTKAKEAVNDLEKAFSEKYHWNENECGENINNDEA